MRRNEADGEGILGVDLYDEEVQMQREGVKIYRVRGTMPSGGEECEPCEGCPTTPGEGADLVRDVQQHWGRVRTL